MEASRFGSLPGELRNRIYRFIFTSPNLELAEDDAGRIALVIHVGLDKAQPYIFGILGTCKAIRHECISLLVPSTLRFVVTIPEHMPKYLSGEIVIFRTGWVRRLETFVEVFPDKQMTRLQSVECAVVEEGRSSNQSNDASPLKMSEYLALANPPLRNQGSLWRLWKAIRILAPNCSMDVSVGQFINAPAMDTSNMTLLTARVIEQGNRLSHGFSSEQAKRQLDIASHNLMHETTSEAGIKTVKENFDKLARRYRQLLFSYQRARESTRQERDLFCAGPRGKMSTFTIMPDGTRQPDIHLMGTKATNPINLELLLPSRCSYFVPFRADFAHRATDT